MMAFSGITELSHRREVVMWLRPALSSLQLNPGILLLLENNVMTFVSPVIILESKVSADTAELFRH